MSRKRKNDDAARDSVKIHGFFRLNIVEGNKVVGDTGWCKNQITNEGFRNFLVRALSTNGTGSSQVSYVALGTGTVPGAAATTLDGEIMSSTQRKSVTFATNGSTTAEFTATFASSNSFISGNSNISNIGLFAATTTNATLFAGNTYASSTLGTNQDVNVTYQIRFS